MWFRRGRRRRRGESGQTSTEYVLVISVLAIAMVSAASAFYDNRGPFHRAMKKMSRNIETSVAQPPAGGRGRP